MRTKLKSLYILFFFFITTIGISQNSETGNWFLYFGNQKINKKWSFHNELQYRNYNFVGDLEQLLIRTGIGYDLSDNNNNILLGYAFVHSEKYITGTDIKNNTTEHRIFQQFISKQEFGRMKIQHRYRFEQRFIDSNFKMRFRYFLSLNVPVNKTVMEKNAVYVSAYNEIFINTKRTQYDRNRIYGGVGYCFNKNFKMEVGLMSQIIENSSRTQFQIMIFNNLPF